MFDVLMAFLVGLVHFIFFITHNRVYCHALVDKILHWLAVLGRHDITVMKLLAAGTPNW